MIGNLKKTIDNKKNWYFFLLVLSFLLYGNTLKNDYTIDDHYVTNNVIIKKGLKALPEIFSSYYASDENNNNYEYRPIVKATFALEYQLFNNNPLISHLINIILYFFSLSLLYLFLRSFLPSQNRFYHQVVVILFATLPIHTEVVASLKNRDILLCYNFTFLSIITLHKYIHLNKKHLLLLSYLFSSLAFLSKIEALPFIMLVPILFIKAPGFNFKKKFPVLLVFLLSYITFTSIKYFALDGSLAGNRLFYDYEIPASISQSVISKISVGFNCLGFYIKNLIFPTHLSCYYGLYTIPLSISMYYFIGLILCVILFLLFIKNITKQNELSLGILLFVLPISIYLHIIVKVPGIVADRFVFFASTGYVIIIGYFINQLYSYFLHNKKKSIKYVNFIIIIFFTSYLIGVIKRNNEWKNNLTLYQSDVKKWPNSIKLNILYANEIVENINKRTRLINPNEYEKYIEISYNHMLKAYNLDSTYYNSLNTLAYIDLSFYNNPKKAVYWLNKAQKYDSINYEIPLNICLAYMRIQNTDSVKKYYLKTLKLNSTIESQLNSAINNYYKEIELPKQPFIPKNNK